MKERLDKYLASQTSLSRKEAAAAIRGGRVMLNGAVIRTGDSKLDPQADIVMLDGGELTYKKYVYYMMDKPAGVVCATRDRNERTVLDLLPAALRREGLFPAGRLDKDTTGLLILTDDGDYAHRMLAPRKHVAKRYVATLDRAPGEDITPAFAAGMVLADGTVCKSAVAEPLGGLQAAVELSEGKYHQVKRMFAAAGYRVTALRRVRIGALSIDPALGPGGVRELSAEEAARVFVSG